MSSQEPDNSGLPDLAGDPQQAGEDPSAEAQLPSRPGAQLLAERRAQGLSLGDVARQLKLSVRQVEALERDEYAAFPGAVFVRGFLRNYAKLLQLDPEALVAQAAISSVPAVSAAPSVPLTPVPLQEPGGGRRSRFGFGSLAVVVVLLIVVVAAIYDARNKPAPVSLTPASPPTSAHAPSPQHADSPPPLSPDTSAPPAPVASVPAATPAAGDATGTVVPAAAPVGSAPAPAAAASASAASQSSGGTAEVKLAFDDESWVEITDRTGTVIFSRLNPAGAERAVSGEPPLEVVIGNAHAVRLTYRDKPVDLAPHTRVDVARVKLE